MTALSVDLSPFLLHEDALVRDSVGFHHYESWSTSEELAPLVLEACQRYGEDAALNLLSFGCRFPLSAGGLLEALRALATSRPPFVEQWVSTAPLVLVKSRAELIRSVLSPRALSRLDRRASLGRETTSALWRRLEGHSRRLDDRVSEPPDWDEVEDLLEALSQRARRESVMEQVVALHEVESPHLRWALIDLTGIMKLDELGETIVDLLGKEEGVARVASLALARMASPSLVASLGARYRDRRRPFRRFALSVLKAVKLEVSEALLRELIAIETEPALRGRILDALRFHFTSESETLLRRELQSPTSGMVPAEIEKALYVFACLRGAPESEIERLRSWRESMEGPEVRFHLPFDEPREA